MIKLEFEAPAPEEARDFISAAMCDAGKAAMDAWPREKQRLADIADIDSWMARQRDPYVRASTYGIPAGFKSYNMFSQYGVLPEHQFREMGDPPVLMRGAKETIQAKYRSSWGGAHKGDWAEKVIMRFLRVKQFTSIDRDEINDVIGNLIQRCHIWHYATRDAMLRNLGVYRRVSTIAYISGVPYECESKAIFNSIRHQHALVKKLDRLAKAA